MNTQSLQDFWTVVVEVWSNGVGGVDIGQILNALGILLAFFVLRGLIAKFLIGWLRRMAQKTVWKMDDHVVDAIAPPLRAIPVVFGIFRVQRQSSSLLFYLPVVFGVFRPWDSPREMLCKHILHAIKTKTW